MSDNRPTGPLTKTTKMRISLTGVLGRAAEILDDLPEDHEAGDLGHMLRTLHEHLWLTRCEVGGGSEAAVMAEFFDLWVIDGAVRGDDYADDGGAS